MNSTLIALAACVFLIFCPPRHHRAVHSHADVPTATVAKTSTLDATGKDCNAITAGFAGDQDEWVRKYPVKQQRRVLLCLSEIKGQ